MLIMSYLHNKIFILAYSNPLWLLFSKPTDTKNNNNNIAILKTAITTWLAVKKVSKKCIADILTHVLAPFTSKLVNYSRHSAVRL